jgi:hypothetical protein
VTYYVLFFIDLGRRRVSTAGITNHPDASWMDQMARNATLEQLGFLQSRRYVLHDRTRSRKGRVRSAKEENLSRLILFGESSLVRAVMTFAEHYHGERNHQGKENALLFPAADQQ